MSHRVVHRVTKWTPERDAKLVGLFEYGLRPTDVAAEMGTSISSVEARYRKLKKKEQNNGNQEAYKD